MTTTDQTTMGTSSMNDLCLTCGAEHATELWGASCSCGAPNVVHQMQCHGCQRVMGQITDDDYCGPEKLYCPDCLDAARETPADIEANIVSEHYFTASDAAGISENNHWPRAHDIYAMCSEALGCLTLCVLVLRNGFTVTGQSACASPENFDAEIERKIARQNAVQKISPLMGYALKDNLSSQAPDMA